MQLKPKSAVFLLLRARLRVTAGIHDGAALDLAAAAVLAPQPWEYSVYADQLRRSMPPQFQGAVPPK